MAKLHENTLPTMNFELQVSVPEKIAKLNVPHGDIFHIYTDPEWQEFITFAKDTLNIDIMAEYGRYYYSGPQKLSRLLKSIFTRKTP